MLASLLESGIGQLSPAEQLIGSTAWVALLVTAFGSMREKKWARDMFHVTPPLTTDLGIALEPVVFYKAILSTPCYLNNCLGLEDYRQTKVPCTGR